MINSKVTTDFANYLYTRLPEVYRVKDVENDFILKRFIQSLVAGGTDTIAKKSEMLMGLINPDQLPDEYIPVACTSFGLDFIQDIPVRFQRRLLQNVVMLYKKKGTIAAVKFLAQQLSGFKADVTETEEGGVQFTLVRLDAYDNEQAELELAQSVIQRYIGLFIPVNVEARVTVVYGFSEEVYFNIPSSSLKPSDTDRMFVDFNEDEEQIFIADSLFTESKDMETVERVFDFLQEEFEEHKDINDYDNSSLTNDLAVGKFFFTNGANAVDTVLNIQLGESIGTVSTEQGRVHRMDLRVVGSDNRTYGSSTALYTNKIGNTLQSQVKNGIIISRNGRHYRLTLNTELYGTLERRDTLILDDSTLIVYGISTTEKVLIDDIFKYCSSPKITAYGSYELEFNSELSDMIIDKYYVSGFDTYPPLISIEGMTYDDKAYYNDISTDTTYVYMSVDSGVVKVYLSSNTDLKSLNDCYVVAPLSLSQINEIGTAEDIGTFGEASVTLNNYSVSVLNSLKLPRGKKSLRDEELQFNNGSKSYAFTLGEDIRFNTLANDGDYIAVSEAEHTVYWHRKITPVKAIVDNIQYVGTYSNYILCKIPYSGAYRVESNIFTSSTSPATYGNLICSCDSSAIYFSITLTYLANRFGYTGDFNGVKQYISDMSQRLEPVMFYAYATADDIQDITGTVLGKKLLRIPCYDVSTQIVYNNTKLSIENLVFGSKYYF